jgi:2-haloacid dehalogenase
MKPDPKLNFDSFEWLTFDCYGTLIDWETGILASLNPILLSHGIRCSNEQILELYGHLEAELESENREYITYRDVLTQVVVGLGERLGFVPAAEEARSLPDSLGSWRPFPDTVAALRKLKRKYKLGIISNTDDDLFAQSARHLEVGFDEVVTARQARSYKPALNNFRLAMQRIGVPKVKILHIAQSVYHDVVPARALGIRSVWVNRRGEKAGAGATKPATGTPDLEVRDLRTLAEMAC